MVRPMAVIRRASKYLLVLVVVLGLAYWAWARFRPRPLGASAREEVFQA
jgi:hypothetical protein